MHTICRTNIFHNRSNSSLTPRPPRRRIRLPRHRDVNLRPRHHRNMPIQEPRRDALIRRRQPVLVHQDPTTWRLYILHPRHRPIRIPRRRIRQLVPLPLYPRRIEERRPRAPKLLPDQRVPLLNRRQPILVLARIRRHPHHHLTQIRHHHNLARRLPRAIQPRHQQRHQPHPAHARHQQHHAHHNPDDQPR